MAARTAAGLNCYFRGPGDHRSRLPDHLIVGGCNLRQFGPRRQSGKIERDFRRLGIERQQQIERPGTIRMIHAKGATAQCVTQTFRGVQHIGLAHHRRHAAEQSLLLLRHLLHVVAFAEGRFIAVDMIDADTIRGRSERTGEGLHCARPDRCHNRRQLSILPAQCRGGMGHFHFVSAIDRAGYALFLVDA